MDMATIAEVDLGIECKPEAWSYLATVNDGLPEWTASSATAERVFSQIESACSMFCSPAGDSVAAARLFIRDYGSAINTVYKADPANPIGGKVLKLGIAGGPLIAFINRARYLNDDFCVAMGYLNPSVNPSSEHIEEMKAGKRPMLDARAEVNKAEAEERKAEMDAKVNSIMKAKDKAINAAQKEVESVQEEISVNNMQAQSVDSDKRKAAMDKRMPLMQKLEEAKRKLSIVQSKNLSQF
jgi:hypothetical protein